MPQALAYSIVAGLPPNVSMTVPQAPAYSIVAGLPPNVSMTVPQALTYSTVAGLTPNVSMTVPQAPAYSIVARLPPNVRKTGLIGLAFQKLNNEHEFQTEVYDLLLDQFDSKQSSEAVDLPLTCHPSASFTTFAFRSSEVGHL